MAKWLKRGAFHLDQENMDFSAVSFQDLIVVHLLRIL